MSPTLTLLLQPKLRLAFDNLRLPSPTSRDFPGAVRLLIGISTIAPTCALGPSEWRHVALEDVLEMPIARTDPIPALWATAIFRDDAAMVAAFNPDDPSACLQFLNTAPAFVALRNAVLKVSLEIINGNPKRSASDSTLSKKLARLRDTLRSDVYLDSQRRVNLEIARKDREDYHRKQTGNTAYRFPNNWREIGIREKHETEIGRFKSIARGEKESIRKASRAAVAAKKELRMDLAENRPAPDSIHNKSKAAREFRAQARSSHCFVPPAKAIGYTEFCDTIRTVAADLTQRANVLIAGSLSALFPTRDITDIPNLTPLGDIMVRCSHYRRLHAPPSVLAESYEQSDSFVAVPVPGNVGQAVTQLRDVIRSDIADLDRKQREFYFRMLQRDVAKRLASISPTLKLYKLKQTLLWQGYDWFGIPPSLLWFALRPKSRPPAPLHYMHVSGSELDPTFWRMFDDSFVLPAEFLWQAWGSCYKLKDEVAIRLVRVLPELLRGWDALELGPLVARCNGVAALTDQLVALFTGKRAYEAEPPSLQVLSPYARYDFLEQKRPAALYYPAPLVAVLRRVGEFFQQVRKDLEYRRRLGCENQHLGFSIYWFMEIVGASNSRRIRFVPPSPKRLSIPFAKCPELRPFAGLLPSWPRHYSNSVLSSAGYHHAAVNRHHGHSEYHFDALLWHQGAPAVDVLEREEHAAFIARLIRLEDIV